MLDVQFTVTFISMPLRKAPLVHVLAQVAFAPVLSWADNVPELQKDLIDLGFVRSQREDVAELTFPVGGLPAPGLAPSVQQTFRSSWEFADRAQRTAFVLSEASFVLHTSGYITKELFLETLRRGLELLQRSMKVTLVQRLGLRYIDLVQPDPGERFGNYVHDGLLGYPFRQAPQLHATPGGFATQSGALTPEGMLAIRSAVVPPGRHLPPDLNPGTLLRPERVDPSRAGLVVDFDHFTMFTGPGEAMEFDPTAIVAHMERLHATLREAFYAIATAHAIERWGPWEEVLQA